ncbi:hypothetical protein NDU88_005665 [Pleurodeles waltl]|uniref:Uncharacterized protein n=1 Tax=Pleurodeles waltl TaxID=8319 RepID=A0AAV7VLR8_PLEWA|nr:hypothetical protein NDU88_005665 [Pleurodeles waltl]
MKRISARLLFRVLEDFESSALTYIDTSVSPPWKGRTNEHQTSAIRDQGGNVQARTVLPKRTLIVERLPQTHKPAKNEDG